MRAGKAWKTIKRKCIVCGKALTIRVSGNGRYNKGYYFGKMKVPIEGTGKNVVVGKFKLGKLTGNTVKWTGKNRLVEYWECENCFKDDW